MSYVDEPMALKVGVTESLRGIFRFYYSGYIRIISFDRGRFIEI